MAEPLKRSEAEKRRKLEEDVRRTGARLREALANTEEVMVLMLQGRVAEGNELADRTMRAGEYSEFMAALDRAERELKGEKSAPPPPPRKRSQKRRR